MSRGWSSAGLRTVGDDPNLWTAKDAATWLGPPELTVPQVRGLIRCAQLRPLGKRRVTRYGQAGRHAPVYEASALIKLYDSLYRISSDADECMMTVTAETTRMPLLDPATSSIRNYTTRSEKYLAS